MSDGIAEKAAIEAQRLYPAITRSYPGEDLREFARGGFIAGAEWGRASRDAEVADAREQLALQGAERREDRAALERRVESERTRADKAEAEVKTQADAAVAEIVRLREVIERVREWAHEIASPHPITSDFKRLNRILAAVPVEPQGDRPHYEIIVPGCDCVGCFGEAPGHEDGAADAHH